MISGSTENFDVFCTQKILISHMQGTGYKRGTSCNLLHSHKFSVSKFHHKWLMDMISPLYVWYVNVMKGKHMMQKVFGS